MTVAYMLHEVKSTTSTKTNTRYPPASPTRQRVIECVRRYTPVLRSEAGSCVQLDETYFRESFKGNHAKSTVFVMPRKPP